ncbi:uncharacterized protein FOMMEDRAFT_21970 [Fomitiporia mediterranea MF3/22]|uniref:uncharacterized protein n=1 Tax=Fomitiporia mediterranea (strain MF3/22) TaxID=694068 RepID=UPI0004408140|nr:uncharacterized protein FOMMEDRAFT_21970 [Fomitiporia mediterranea MF3/22]EJD01615.1 hypothetical protein FOMMEDRAFT_21970 [Fomitiporia mediterranea MF3/22]
MYTVFDTNATQIPSEASSSTQNTCLLDPLDFPWIDPSQNTPYVPQLQEEVASPANLTASPFAYSESSLSDFSTPSTALIPTPGSESFEAPLPQAEVSWPMDEGNPQMDLAFDNPTMPSSSTVEMNEFPPLFLPFDFNEPSLFPYGDAQMQLNFNTGQYQVDGSLAGGTPSMDLPPEFYFEEWMNFPQF